MYIPISALVVIIGFVVWLTNMSFATSSNGNKLKKLENNYDVIIKDLSIIKGKLDVIMQNNNN
jgi:uncharacterized Fe-S radical SAM superfamily protein PflX